MNAFPNVDLDSLSDLDLDSLPEVVFEPYVEDQEPEFRPSKNLISKDLQSQLSRDKVIASNGAIYLSNGFIVRDPSEIRPHRDIPPADIVQVIEWYGAPFELKPAIEIGFKLRCWHDLMPSGRWKEWLRQNLPQIPYDRVLLYLRLWDQYQRRCSGLYAADIRVNNIEDTIEFFAKEDRDRKRDDKLAIERSGPKRKMRTKRKVNRKRT